MNRREILRLLATAPAMGAASAVAAASTRPRVAVLDFDSSKVQTEIRAILGTDVGFGRGFADLVMTQLAQTGAYSVIDRTLTKKAMDEQNFSNSDRADLTAAAKIGRLLSAEMFLIGCIEQFSPDSSKTNYGEGIFGQISSRIPGKWGGIITQGSKKLERKSQAVAIRMNYRLVSVDTTAILIAGEANSLSKKTKHSVSGAGASSLGNTVAGDAIHNVVEQMVSNLAEQGPQHFTAQKTLRDKVAGAVLAVDGTTVVVNLGSKDGLPAAGGCSLKVKRVVNQVRDDTGKVIYNVSSELGNIEIRDVQQQASAGVFRGTGEVKVNDIVEFIPAR